MNLDAAAKVGVAYNLTEESVYRTVSDYVKKLQDSGKNVKAIGYVESKRLTGQFLPKLSYDFIYPTNLNWNLKPVSEASRDFVDTEFDILIDLSTEDLLPLLFITGLSKAKFKAGIQSRAKTGILDLMIDIKGTAGLEALTEQLNHYLNIINKENEF
jgi:hypothetical protein